MSVLRVLWMSTHSCSAILFPPYPIDDTSDDGAQEPDATAGAYFQEGPDGTYFWVEPADQE